MSMRKHILLVEDDPNDVELIREGLKESQLALEITVAHDGAEALNYLFCRDGFAARPPVNPAFVILDLKLPKIDGMEVLRQIKADDKLKTIPVVVLTSSQEERDLVQSYRRGVNAYVVKPVDFDEFLGVVKEMGMFWATINVPPPGDQPHNSAIDPR